VTSLSARIDAARKAVPEGTIPVAVGLVVSGLTSYGYLAVTARAVGPARYGSVSVLWSVTYLAALGFFLPLEQEIARALAARRIRGEGGGPVVRRAAQLGVIGLAFLVVLIASSSSLLLSRLFDRHIVLLFGFLLAVIAYFPVHLTRGMLAGSGRFGGYAVLLGGEGVVRLAICLGLAAAGVTTPGGYGLALGLAPFAALAMVIWWTGDARRPGPEAQVAELSSALGWLLASSLLLQALVNGPAVAIKVLASPSEQLQTGRFIAGLLLCRVPLFLFAAIQASLLPKLAAQATSGRLSEFRTSLRRILRLLGTIGAAATLAALGFGPLALRTFFGPGYQLSRVDLAALAAASGAVMITTVFSQGLIAFQEYARVAIGWLIGLVLFAGMLTLPIGHQDRVSLAFVSGSTVAMVLMWLLLRPSLAAGPDHPPKPGSGIVLSEPLVA
jgi:O-antigen/teichoic acid export membrane protein